MKKIMHEWIPSSEELSFYPAHSFEANMALRTSPKQDENRGTSTCYD